MLRKKEPKHEVSVIQIALDFTILIKYRPSWLFKRNWFLRIEYRLHNLDDYVCFSFRLVTDN